MAGYTRTQAIRGTTAAWTRSLRHVKASLPRIWSSRITFQDQRSKDIKPRDRIKWWNIVPGDKVCVRGGGEGTIREVQAVNKLSNMVYLRRQREANEDDAELPKAEGVHYSECQLFVGSHEFPPAEGSSQPRVLNVFASRIEITRPKWDRSKGHFMWTRWAANTLPRLPGLGKKSDERVAIPWPKIPARPKYDPTPYDTSYNAVKQITYVKPALPATLKSPVSSIPSEHKYIQSLVKRSPFNPAAPVEVYVHRELSNPHSRAKKQARWQAQQKHKKQLLDQIMKAEIRNLNGRTRKVAKQEAVWKWKTRLEEERKAEIVRRATNRGDIERLEKRRERKARKIQRMDSKLKALVLDNAPNQVVPGSQESAKA